MNEKNTQAIIESLKNYFSEEIKDGKEVFLKDFLENNQPSKDFSQEKFLHVFLDKLKQWLRQT